MKGTLPQWLFGMLLVWALIAGIDRVYWVNSGTGFAGWIGPKPLADLGVTPCTGDEGAEVKYEGGNLVYRCGSFPLWPFYLRRQGHSPELQAWWESQWRHAGGAQRENAP